MSKKYSAQDDAGTMPMRKRDVLIVKVVDWSDDDPDNCKAYDVEVYVNGEFVPERSQVFEFGRGQMTQKQAYAKAMQFAQAETLKGV